MERRHKFTEYKRGRRDSDWRCGICGQWYNNLKEADVPKGPCVDAKMCSHGIYQDFCPEHSSMR